MCLCVQDISALRSALARSDTCALTGGRIGMRVFVPSEKDPRRTGVAIPVIFILFFMAAAIFIVALVHVSMLILTLTKREARNGRPNPNQRMPYRSIRKLCPPILQRL